MSALGYRVCASQAWESDEAIEEDMPESPVDKHDKDKHDKDKEHRETKKGRGLCGQKHIPPLVFGTMGGQTVPSVLSGSHEEFHRHGLLRQQEDQTQAEEVPDPPAHAAGRQRQRLHQR